LADYCLTLVPLFGKATFLPTHKFFMQKNLPAIGVLRMSIPSRAQLLYGYQFQAQAGTYVPLGASATHLPALEADKAVVNAIPLGFTFVADGRFYTTIVYRCFLQWLAGAFPHHADVSRARLQCAGHCATRRIHYCAPVG
jgi:hypothetical protein